MEFDLTKPHCYYFNEIAKIPHGSKNEKALSDWIVDFAKAHNLRYIQDDMYNVVVYKDATKGYEDHPGVIIQAHIDMVCEKVPESTHNFETDPLELYVEGTHLRAKGTTLGGDDCMGAAYMLDILSDETLEHPYLECCFTTQEEIGLFGAMALKPEYFKARRLINLDGAGEYRTYTTLAGARNMTIRKEAAQSPTDAPAYCLGVHGLLGGRTGDDIGKERANAGKLAARLLLALEKKGAAVRIADFVSANKKAGIAADADVVFTTRMALSEMQAALEPIRAAIAEEYEFSDPDITVTLTAAQAEQAAGETESRELIELIRLLPFGVFQRFLPLDGLPSFSANVGKIETVGGAFEIHYAARSPFESCMDEAETTVSILCGKLGAEIVAKNDYYGYRYLKDSPLRDTMDRVFMAQYLGRDIFTRLVNGGRVTMTVGAVSVIITMVLGLLIGGFSGYFGGLLDMILMRVAEVISGIPFLPFALILSSIIPSSVSLTQRMYLIMVVLGLLSWPSLARLVRAQVLAVREQEYVMAAKAMGVKEISIVFRHIIPNILSVILVNVTLSFATCMLTESSLSYLGFGIIPPTPTWGNMLTGCNNSVVIQQYWWRWVFPAAIFGICTIAINLIGDGLRDAVDPKAEER